jgi:hypothetical protein
VLQKTCNQLIRYKTHIRHIFNTIRCYKKLATSYKEKTNSERKSPRKYQLIDHSESMVAKPSHGKLDDVAQNANQRLRRRRRPNGQRQITESLGYVQQYITFN